ncbi:hypothetical protein OSB04_un000046 [Centaurea solstitialis]|uniref:F-box domain-containing protein n=1 Tax=Centaurea solstitialis TaxID=347529 RepID=A0AA38SP99_9ASTR|nr:hypothetical protein OSB04_un000046 [Centaurea solstitialis]
MKMKMLPWLEFDIQVEILKRLPVKSLIQFRSVCKEWKSLIDSSPFIADHNNVGQEHLMIRYEVEDKTGSEVKYVCFVDDYDSFPENKFAPDIPPIFRLFRPFNTTIHSPCGLLCLEGLLREPDNSETHMVVLWNPSIRKSIAIVVPKNKNASIETILGFKKTGEPVVKIEFESLDDVDSALIAVYEPHLDHIKDLGICRGAAFFAMCSYNESLLLLDHDDDGRIVRAVEN